MTYAPRLKSRLTRPGDPFTFRERLEAAWEANPTLGIRDAMRTTGASRLVVITVRKRLIAAGQLTKTPHDGERA